MEWMRRRRPSASAFFFFFFFPLSPSPLSLFPPSALALLQMRCIPRACIPPLAVSMCASAQHSSSAARNTLSPFQFPCSLFTSAALRSHPPRWLFMYTHCYVHFRSQTIHFFQTIYFSKLNGDNRIIAAVLRPIRAR